MTNSISLLGGLLALEAIGQRRSHDIHVPQLPAGVVKHFTPEFEKRSKRSMRRERGKMKAASLRARGGA